MNKLTTKLFLSLIFSTTYSIKAQQVIFQDSFERLTDFAVTNVGNWILRDGDESPNIHSILEADFPNNDASSIRSFIVFNPSTITRAYPGFGYNAEAFRPIDGQKYMVNIANYGDNTGYTENNDWLISPKITLGANNNRITFWAKSLKAFEPVNSSINVAISTTTTNINSFAFINNNAIQIADPEDIEGGRWSQYSIDIPSNYDNQNVYIAINTIANSYFLMFDNFTVTAENQQLGLDEIASKNSISVYPNPASNSITVKTNANQTDGFDYTIIDLSGRVIRNGKSKFNESINIENISSGNYFINIKTKEGLTLKKQLLKK